MDKKVILKINMVLLSDAILGSGYSIPGEEDIAVCQDENGYPYMKGSSFKGLLKESMENLAAWQQINPGEVEEMTGAADWNGASEGRRIHVTSLKLSDPPYDPEECYERRAFTSLENGVIKKGTLRTAVCIVRGSVFTGELTCAEEDARFISQALMGIKYVGTLRNRGFGHVKLTSEICKKRNPSAEIEATCCLHYRIKTELPVVITDLNRSKGYHYETVGYIPGSAIRGMVMGKLAAGNPSWFQEHKKEALREMYFLDAVPNHEGKTVIPSIKGFYEKKDGSDFQSVLKDGELSPGVKRAGMGSFCSIEENRVIYWSAKTGGITRIRKGSGEDKLMFQRHYLCENQEFDGYILLKNPEYAKVIANSLGKECWVGSDRYEGFGKCEITLEKCSSPKWRTGYGYTKTTPVGKILYLLAVSPFCMLDELGNPCGLNEKEIADLLEIPEVKIQFCSTAVSEFRAYNRTWRCADPTVCMYDRGSIFKLECSDAPNVENVLQLQENGLGIRKEQGFGQILILRPDIYENIIGKLPWEEKKEEKKLASVRRAKISWILGNDNGWKGMLSNSQIGEVQGLLERAVKQDGDTEELEEYFDKNISKRGVKHGERFVNMEKFIKQILRTPMSAIIGVPCVFTSEKQEKIEKIKLLCELFDYSRKGKEV